MQLKDPRVKGFVLWVPRWYTGRWQNCRRWELRLQREFAGPGFFLPCPFGFLGDEISDFALPHTPIMRSYLAIGLKQWGSHIMAQNPQNCELK